MSVHDIIDGIMDLGMEPRLILNFMTITDLLEWILRHNYNVGFNVDFHTVGPPF